MQFEINEFSRKKKKKLLKKLITYAITFSNFVLVRFTPLSFTEASLQCIYTLLRHTGYNERSIIRARLCLDDVRFIYNVHVFIGGKLEKLLWDGHIMALYSCK